ncbi:MAG: hypothetical protein M1160_02265 [Candidatus Marsarchaeota archaeon]|jgi:hypothetical protein|nr:hypothetical protein [Candidatus Marsarchaeota archaeon]MCL5111684.1 hypothetical protein [Candidatus Marsarchaeota archaeon]
MRLDIDKYVPYILITACFVALALGAATLNPYVVSLAAALSLSALVLHKMWGIIEARIFERTNLVQVFSGFELSGNRSVIISRSAKRYTATSAARVVSLGTTVIDREKIENMIAHTNFPFKLVMHVERVGVARLLERLQTRKGLKEIELSRIEDPGSGKGLVSANRLKSEISLLEHEIEGINGGGMPLRLAYYAMTSAVSESRHKAEEEALVQIRSLSSEFDATFGTRSSLLSGEEMVRMMRFDSAVL